MHFWLPCLFHRHNSLVHYIDIPTIYIILHFALKNGYFFQKHQFYVFSKVGGKFAFVVNVINFKLLNS